MRPSLARGAPSAARSAGQRLPPTAPPPLLLLLPSRGGPASTRGACPGLARRAAHRCHGLALSRDGPAPANAAPAGPRMASGAPANRVRQPGRSLGPPPPRRSPHLTAALPANLGPDSEPGPGPVRPASAASSPAKQKAAVGAGNARGPLATPGPLNADPLGSADEDVDILVR